MRRVSVKDRIDGGAVLTEDVVREVARSHEPSAAPALVRLRERTRRQQARRVQMGLIVVGAVCMALVGAYWWLGHRA